MVRYKHAHNMYYTRYWCTLFIYDKRGNMFSVIYIHATQQEFLHQVHISQNINKCYRNNDISCSEQESVVVIVQLQCVPQYSEFTFAILKVVQLF